MACPRYPAISTPVGRQVQDIRRVAVSSCDLTAGAGANTVTSSAPCVTWANGWEILLTYGEISQVAMVCEQRSENVFRNLACVAMAMCHLGAAVAQRAPRARLPRPCGASQHTIPNGLVVQTARVSDLFHTPTWAAPAGQCMTTPAPKARACKPDCGPAQRSAPRPPRSHSSPGESVPRGWP